MRSIDSVPMEIERKFLVNGEGWRHQAGLTSQRYRQGYLARGDVTVRVRVRGEGVAASLTVKSRRQGIARMEFEYAIPVADGETFLRRLCPQSLVEKIRHKLRYRGHVWTIDEFDGHNSGLVLAEIELSHPYELFDVPDWIGRDVTHEERYRNSVLAQAPDDGNLASLVARLEWEENVGRI